jgi:hypothetical protein
MAILATFAAPRSRQSKRAPYKMRVHPSQRCRTKTMPRCSWRHMQSTFRCTPTALQISAKYRGRLSFAVTKSSNRAKMGRWRSQPHFGRTALGHAHDHRMHQRVSAGSDDATIRAGASANFSAASRIFSNRDNRLGDVVSDAWPNVPSVHGRREHARRIEIFPWGEACIQPHVGL